MTLYIFNPEHDLCLANGDPNYVPPASALDFAEKACGVMRIIYGEDAAVTTAAGFGDWLRQHASDRLEKIVPWGWDARLKETLLRSGADSSLLPDDRHLEIIRKMQHRSTILPLQPHSHKVVGVEEVQELLVRYRCLVLKAPWSGSGRGLRWVTDALSTHDKSWIIRTVAMQGCVIAEQRQRVKDDFAIEFRVHDGEVSVAGLSLFVTQSGVYRHNILLSDDAIRKRVGLTLDMENKLKKWIGLNVAPCYNGCIGIDMLAVEEGGLLVSEMNLRHTMGLAAHCFLEKNPGREGEKWECVRVNAIKP